MICQMACLVSEIIKRERFLIFHQNLDRIFILNPCQSRGFLLKGFYHVKETQS